MNENMFNVSLNALLCDVDVKDLSLLFVVYNLTVSTCSGGFSTQT